ncbi:MAG: metal-dependent hydrolase [Myxococcales bacterium]
MLLGLRRRLPPWPLYLGCLLPDLIDKPLFYLLGPTALLTGTRTFGHTGLFLLAWLLVAALSRRPWAWAIFAGICTHFALDIAGELLTGPEPDQSIWQAILYPAYEGRFPVAHYTTVLEHLQLTAQNWYVIAGEILGAAILLYGRWRRLE